MIRVVAFWLRLSSTPRPGIWGGYSDQAEQVGGRSGRRIQRSGWAGREIDKAARELKPIEAPVSSTSRRSRSLRSTPSWSPRCVAPATRGSAASPSGVRARLKPASRFGARGFKIKDLRR